MTNLNHLKSIVLAATSGEWKSIDGGEITGIRVDLVTATELIEEIEAYRAALQFYADSENYQYIFEDESRTILKVFETYGPYSIGDLGVKAREVLKKFGGRDE